MSRSQPMQQQQLDHQTPPAGEAPSQRPPLAQQKSQTHGELRPRPQPAAPAQEPDALEKKSAGT